MDYYATEYYTSDLTPTEAAALGGISMVWVVVALVIAVFSIIAWWKMFEKAGEKGWKSIIPIYNMVILFKISGLSPWLLILYIIPFVNIIAVIVIQIMLAINLSKSFGKSTGFAFGLYFLNTIFMLILGFGDAKYIGPNGDETAKV